MASGATPFEMRRLAWLFVLLILAMPCLAGASTLDDRVAICTELLAARNYDGVVALCTVTTDADVRIAPLRAIALLFDGDTSDDLDAAARMWRAGRRAIDPESRPFFQLYDDEIERLRVVSDRGDAVASYALGVAFQQGMVVEKSHGTALFYYLLALSDGQDAAADAIARLLAYGDLAVPAQLVAPRKRNSGPAFVGTGPTHMPETAVSSFPSVAQQLVPPPRRQSAARTPGTCATAATEQNFILPTFGHAALASLQSGARALLGGNSGEAMRLWQQAGEGGGATLQYVIGMLLISQPEKQALAEGQKWLQAAADNGLADLRCLVGPQGD